MRYAARQAGSTVLAGQHLALGLQRHASRQIAQQGRFPDFMLAFGQDAPRFPGDEQCQGVKVFFKQARSAAENFGFFAGVHGHPLRLRSGGHSRCLGNVRGIGNTYGAQDLARGGFDHLAHAVAECSRRGG